MVANKYGRSIPNVGIEKGWNEDDDWNDEEQWHSNASESTVIDSDSDTELGDYRTHGKPGSGIGGILPSSQTSRIGATTLHREQRSRNQSQSTSLRRSDTTKDDVYDRPLEPSSSGKVVIKPTS